MAGFNLLKERTHTFEDAAKIIGWDTDSLLRKASEGKITPLVYLEWEIGPTVMPVQILTPEWKAEWDRLVQEGIVMNFGSWCNPRVPIISKGEDWLILGIGYYDYMIKHPPPWSVVSCTIFSHKSFTAPPMGHYWDLIFSITSPPKISIENLFLRDLDLRRIDSQFEINEEGKEKRIWKIQLNKELYELKNLFKELEWYELFASESLERLYQHFNSFSLRDPVPDHATPLQWLGTWNSLVYVLRRLRGTEWIEATDKSLEQNHFITKEGKPFKIGKGSVDENTSDVKDVKEILKTYL